MKQFRWKPHVEKLRELAAAGLTSQQIADHFGVTESSAHNALYRNKIRLNPEAVKERQRARGRTLVHSNPQKWWASMKSESYRMKRASQMRRMWSDPEYRHHQKKLMWAAYQDGSLTAFLSECGRKGMAVVNQILRKRREEKKLFESMTPFEKQLWMVRNGKAKIVRVRPVPTADNDDFTLGGVATYEG